jgi:hypothetical protein
MPERRGRKEAEMSKEIEMSEESWRFLHEMMEAITEAEERVEQQLPRLGFRQRLYFDEVRRSLLEVFREREKDYSAQSNNRERQHRVITEGNKLCIKKQ